MTDQHPITPPPELVREWYIECPESNEAALVYVATQAARWGADQELEACCEWLKYHHEGGEADALRAARRPVQPSLKEQALQQLECIQIDLNKFCMSISTATIRRALEQLDD